MPSAGKKRRPRGRVTPRAKVWLEVDGQYVFGRGISDILKAVAETGSIKAAAVQLGKSYRHVWAKIKKTEQALGAPLVDARVGGKDARRSDLTELGAELVRDFDALRDQTVDLVREEFRRRVSATLARHRRG